MKALVGAFNQEKALVVAFSMIVQPVVEPMDRFVALFETRIIPPAGRCDRAGGHGAGLHRPRPHEGRRILPDAERDLHHLLRTPRHPATGAEAALPPLARHDLIIY